MRLRNTGMKNRRDFPNVLRGVRLCPNIFELCARSLFRRELFFRLQEMFHLMEQQGIFRKWTIRIV
jgi:hypothetical protein